jgi:hypothetical protein
VVEYSPATPVTRVRLAVDARYILIHVRNHGTQAGTKLSLQSGC